MEFWSVVLLCSLLGTLLYFQRRSRSRKKPGNLPPQAPGMPLLGNISKNDLKFSKTASQGRKMGGIFYFWSLQMTMVVITDWKLIKEALLRQSTNFNGVSFLFVRDLITKRLGISSSDGPLWKVKRSLAVNHMRNLGFGRASNEANIHEEIANIVGMLDDQNGRPVQINGLFFAPIMNIVWSLVAGKKYSYDDPEMNRVHHLIERMTILIKKTAPLNVIPCLRFLPGDPWGFHELVRCYHELTNFVERELEECERELQRGAEPRTFMDAYLADIANLKDRQVDGVHPYQKKHLLGIAEDLLLAGVYSTMTVVEWSLLYLAVWPDIQERVQQELDTVVGQGHQLCCEDGDRLPYTKATILEIHRFASIAADSLPYRSTKTTTLGGYTIHAGMNVYASFWAVHHDERLWGDPEVFRPERFIDADGKVEKPEYLIPFGMGARTCIGSQLANREIFLFLATLLQRFSFRQVTSETPLSLEPKEEMAVFIGPKPFRLAIRKRLTD